MDKMYMPRLCERPREEFRSGLQVCSTYCNSINVLALGVTLKLEA